MWLFKRIWNQESFGNGIPNWIGRRRFRSDGSGIGGGDASSQSGGMSGNLLVTSESENIYLKTVFFSLPLLKLSVLISVSEHLWISLS